MHVPDDHLRREIALFRYRIIADLLLLPPGSPGIGALLQAKAEHQHTIPGTHRIRVAAETIRDWLQLYRRGGFDALYPKKWVSAAPPPLIIQCIRSPRPGGSCRCTRIFFHGSNLPDPSKDPSVKSAE